jgi:uncharacterized membrane protein YphA (DoxX/SURF4 family)
LHHVINFLLAIIVVVILSSILQSILAESPDYTRQELLDKRNDQVTISHEKDDWFHILSRVRLVEPSSDPSNDIHRVTYSSDGRLLNATMWLGSTPFNNSAYGVLVETDSNQASGQQGIDYRIELGRSTNSNEWRTSVQEIESPITGLVDKIELANYTVNMTPGKIVRLTVDLKDIGSPERYSLIFYARKDLGPGLSSIDFSDRTSVPFPQYTLITKPAIIELRRDDEQKIEIQLESNYQQIGVFGYGIQDKPSIIDRVMFEERDFNTSTVNPISLTIHIDRNAKSGSYVLKLLPIYSSQPSFLFLGESNVRDGQVKSLVFNEGVGILQMDLPIYILDPLTFQEQLSLFNEKWITPINGIYGFIGVIAVGVISWSYQSYQNQRGHRPAHVDLKNLLSWYGPLAIRSLVLVVYFFYMWNILSSTYELNFFYLVLLSVLVLFIAIGLVTRIMAVLLLIVIIILAIYFNSNQFSQSSTINQIVLSATSTSLNFGLILMSSVAALIVTGPGKVSLEWDVLKHEIFFLKNDRINIVRRYNPMEVTVGNINDNYQLGEMISIRITVNDINGPIEKAVIKGRIINISNDYSVNLEDNITDNKGQCWYQWKLNEKGRFKIRLNVSAQDHDSLKESSKEYVVQ